MERWAINVDRIATDGRVKHSAPNSDSKLPILEFIKAPQQVGQDRSVVKNTLALITECNDESGEHCFAKLGVDLLEKCGERELSCPALLSFQLARLHHVGDNCNAFTSINCGGSGAGHVNRLILTLKKSIYLQ